MGNVIDINRNKAGQNTDGATEDVLFQYEDLRVSRAQAVKYALATAAVTALAVGAVIGVGRAQNSGAPSTEEIKGSTPTTQPSSYDPDKANPSGIPHS